MKSLAILFLFFLLFGCKVQNQPNVSSPKPTETVKKEMPPTVSENSKLQGEGNFDGYEYSYKKDGNKIMAVFPKKMLPRNDDVFKKAVYEVVKNVNNDEIRTEPSVVEKNIVFETSRNIYFVFPIKENTGEIHTLMITIKEK